MPTLSLWQRFLCLLALLLLALPLAAAQTAEQATPAPAPEAKAETRITSEQAAELFSQVDNILAFVSEQTGLPVRHPVKRQLSDRKAVEEHMQERLAEDEDAQRLKRSELVLKKFGLLPRNFDLHSFLIALMREQVAGFYNFKTQTVHLLDWVELNAQLPLLAHELTHAVQDQNFPLEAWIRGRREKKTGLDPKVEIETDEGVAARQAVAEGQAMVVLVNFMLAGHGKDILDSPEVVEAMKSGMADVASSPIFASAPLYIQEALTFPYLHGMDFTIAVLREKGPEHAFRGLLESPPRSTRHILMPQTYLNGEKLEPLPVPDFAALLPQHELYDAGAMGQLDVQIMLQQYGMKEPEARRTAAGWTSGYYYAGRPKSLKGEPQSKDLALLFVTRFSDPVQAGEMMRLYASSLERRYPGARAVNAQGKSMDTPDQMNFETSEGTVRLQTKGSLLLVSEGLDAATSRRVAETILREQ